MTAQVRYFHPEDVIVEVVSGVRTARLNLDAPVIWTPEAVKRAKADLLSGWEIARQAFRDKERAAWSRRVYPAYYREKVLSTKWYNDHDHSMAGFSEWWESYTHEKKWTQIPKNFDEDLQNPDFWSVAA